MIINPELTAATEIARLLRTPKAIEISTFARGRAELLSFSLEKGNPLNGLSLLRMNQKLGTDVLVCAVERGRRIIIPNGSFVFQQRDIVSIAGSPGKTAHFFQKIGMSAGQAREVLIVGGSRIAYYLAYQLLSARLSVKILEQDPDRCSQLSEQLPEALVIQGNCRNQELLMEEGFTETQAIVTLTNLDEENLMLSMLAAVCNPQARLVTKVSQLPFEEVLQKLNLGSLICPKELAAEHILQYIRAMENPRGSGVEALYRILDNKAEALEFRIQSPSPVVGTPLKDLPIHPGILVAVVIRNGRAFNPGGNDQLLVGDSVIVVTSESGLRDITDILRKR